MKKGDLIRFKRTGEFATIVRETYTRRFLDASDNDMVNHGMSHLAGVYASAIDIMYMKDGRKKTIKLDYPRTFDIVSKCGK